MTCEAADGEMSDDNQPCNVRALGLHVRTYVHRYEIMLTIFPCRVPSGKSIVKNPRRSVSLCLSAIVIDL